MANSPPMLPPPPHPPLDPPPPPSYRVAIAQKKANHHATAKSNGVHTVGGHVRTNAEKRMNARYSPRKSPRSFSRLTSMRSDVANDGWSSSIRTDYNIESATSYKIEGVTDGGEGGRGDSPIVEVVPQRHQLSSAYLGSNSVDLSNSRRGSSAVNCSSRMISMS